MAWYLVVISLLILGSSNAVLTKRSNNNQPQFEQYEIQSFATASSNPNPVGNIINAISAPLNILADRLTRNPIAQQFNAALNSQRRPPPFQYGPPPGHGHSHFGHAGHHHGPHEHHGHHEHQQNNQFQYPPQPVPPIITYLPSAQNTNRDKMNINPQNPFLNPNQPQETPYPQRPSFFPFGQNYPKPGFSKRPNDNNVGNNGCIGFCQPPQPQQPNQFGNNGFDGRPNLVQGNFGNNGSPALQPQPTQNPFINNGFNNNNFGNPFNTPQPNNNGFGTPNVPSQGNDLITGTFAGFGSNDNRTPQPQANNIPTNPVGQTTPGFLPGQQQPYNNVGNTGQAQTPTGGNDLIEGVFGGLGTPQNPQTNNNVGNTAQTQTPSGGNDLIEGVFGGIGTPQNPQTNNNNNIGNNGQTQTPSGGNDLIEGVFGGFGTPQNPQTNNNNNIGNTGQTQTPSGGNGLIEGVFGGFGTPQNPQTNNNNNIGNTGQTQTPSGGNDLIEGVFGGFGTPQNPQTNNNNNIGNTGQTQTPSGGNDLIEGVFAGFGTPSTNSGNNAQPTTENSPQQKDNNDLISSIFSGLNDNKGQNVPQTDGTRTTTIPPTTTNSNGFIYDIDVRSS